MPTAAPTASPTIAQSDPSDTVLIATTTCPPEGARQLADTLVENGVAACVQIDSPVHSVYRWAGALCRDAEARLTIKTTRRAWPRLQAAVRAAHPYELPQLVAVEATECSDDYCQWVLQHVQETTD